MATTLTPSTSPAGSAPEATDPGAGRRGAILAVVCLALALVVAGVAMLNVALATMTRALGASQTDQQWIVDGYAVALAALLLFAGALGDRFPTRQPLHLRPSLRLLDQTSDDSPSTTSGAHCADPIGQEESNDGPGLIPS